MNARLGLKGAALALLAAGATQAAEPSRGPAMRQVNTPAGPMLVLQQPPPPATATAASAPLTDVQSTPGGPMLVLRDPAAARSAASVGARTLAKSSMPSSVRAEALPNGAQMLVMPTREPASAPVTARTIVEIDPGQPGTRPSDTPRNDVLYRPLSAASAASAPKR